MSRAHVRSRVIALVAGATVALSATLTVSAAGPRPVVAPRPTGEQPAWDRPDPRNVDGGTRLIIQFAPGTSARDRRAAATASPTVQPVADVPSARIGVVALPADATPAQVATATAAISAAPSVQSVSVDHRRYRDARPDGRAGLARAVGPREHGPGHRSAAPPARTASPTSTSMRAPPSRSRPATRARSWRSSTTASTSAIRTSPRGPGRTRARSGGGKETNGIDDDGNGYVDDVHGWDFCHDDNTVHDVDDDFHGTHVAGTIAASLDGEGVVGVAPASQAMALKFLGDDDACGFDSQAIAAIAYAKHRSASTSPTPRGAAAAG